jgi:hypothetical protein
MGYKADMRHRANQKVSEMAVFTRNRNNLSVFEPAALSLLDRPSCEPLRICPELSDGELEVAAYRSHHVDSDIRIAAFDLTHIADAVAEFRRQDNLRDFFRYPHLGDTTPEYLVWRFRLADFVCADRFSHALMVARHTRIIIITIVSYITNRQL